MLSYVFCHKIFLQTGMNIGNHISRREKVVVDFHTAPKLPMFLVSKHILLHFDICVVQFDKGFVFPYHLEVDHRLGLGTEYNPGTPYGVHWLLGGNQRLCC